MWRVKIVLCRAIYVFNNVLKYIEQPSQHTHIRTFLEFSTLAGMLPRDQKNVQVIRTKVSDFCAQLF